MPAVVIESLEELRTFVGREIATTDWVEVTQSRIAQFADATGDHQWIHLDRDRARRESPYATTVAHGFLSLSLLSYLLGRALEIRSGFRLAVNYGLNRVRFPAPVFSDSKVRARFTLQSMSEVVDGYQAVFSVVVENQGQGKPCCVAEWVLRYYP